MSLKAVELQVALPRTQEISRIQEQLQQKSMHEQQQLIEDRKQLDEGRRQRAANVDETARNQIREREKQQDKRKKQKKPSAPHSDLHAGESAVYPESVQSAKPSAMRDPLRGRHIDISL
ncbi:hypothetical protein [Brevibacillus sp. H7]|uniref:hypothetical protein n=1 Tax=Brevibacillus sp. H7 TaxID=3349138 RepID=UPI003808D326